MVIFLNGAFGIGKTTVARELKRNLTGSLIFDPEKVGFVLRRLPRWVPLDGRNSQDYQDMRLWRALTALGIRATRLSSKKVIVPMAFSNLSYLDEVREQVRRFDTNIFHFCLVAPFEIVEKRVFQRSAHRTTIAWQLRRTAECCKVHRRPEFGQHISTAHRSIDEITTDILSRLYPNLAPKQKKGSG
jgi:hypothetical protein